MEASSAGVEKSRSGPCCQVVFVCIGENVVAHTGDVCKPNLRGFRQRLGESDSTIGMTAGAAGAPAHR